MNMLGVVEETASWGLMDGESVTTEQARCLDLTVDGVLLRELLVDFPIEERPPVRSGFIVGAARAWVSELMNPVGGELQDGYAPLYMCQLCGDLGCGFLSVRIDRDETAVRWSDFGWGDPAEEGYEVLEDSPAFRFDPTAYDALLRDILARAERSVIEVRGSGRLWWKTPAQSFMKL